MLFESDFVSRLPDYTVALVFFGLAAAVNYRLRRNRFESLRELADRYHLASMENTLPGDFPHDVVDKRPWSMVRDAFSGTVGPDTLLVTDIKVGWGRQAFTRTVVGRRFETLPHSPTLPKKLWYKESGHWRIAFLQPGLFFLSSKMRPELVEQVWNLLAGPGHARLSPYQPGQQGGSSEILIRPRKR